MNVTTKKSKSSALYEADFFAWTEEQARALAERRADSLDWSNLSEEIQDLGGSQKREIRKRMMRLLRHLLKWEFQPERRCHSWQSTISGQRIAIDVEIDASPSLARYPAAIARDAFARARREAARETGLPLSRFPEELPYSIDDILSGDFMPGEPWSPEQLIRD